MYIDRIPRIFFVVIALATGILTCRQAEAAALPDLVGWHLSDIQTIVLDTVSGNQGTWTIRAYRSAQGTAQATLMEGKGISAFTAHPSISTEKDGPLGSGASYRAFMLGNRPAVAEHHPVLGLSLSLALPHGVLTLESGNYGLDEEDLISLAKEIAAQIQQ